MFIAYSFRSFIEGNVLIPRIKTISELCATNTLVIIIFSGIAAQRGLWPPRPRAFLITHNDVPQSAGLLWTSDQLVAETST
jgi:hypothetical protein